MIWFFRLSTVLLAIAILVFSLEPATDFQGPLYADKVQHFLAYGLLAFLIALGWPKMRLVFVILLAALFGIGVEIAQGLTHFGRTASLFDAGANLIGASFGAYFSSVLSKLSRRRSS